MGWPLADYARKASPNHIRPEPSGEAEELHGLHACELADVAEDRFVHRAVEREEQHRFPALVAAAEVEGADIDLRLAQRRTQAADEARRVLVDADRKSNSLNSSP